MMTVLFLEAILPRGGLRCIVVLGGERPRQRFFATNEGAAAYALAQDKPGLSVYHACATYKDRSSRKAKNVHELRSLWLDIDAGSGKAFSDVPTAIKALGIFTRSVRLPVPTVVISGNGVHAYWTFDDPVGTDVWRRYAEGLRAACVSHGFPADPVRTCDAASILRLVGTYNRKHGNETSVVWSGAEGPYPLGTFAVLLSSAGPSFGARPSYVPLAQPGAFDTLRGPAQTPSDPADANAIADRCAQIGACRDTRGKLPEPLWRACLSVLSYCDMGESFAHEWSKGDPRYDPVEVQRKLALITGPHKCKTFREYNAAGCEGCRFVLEVSTPLELGRSPFTAPVNDPISVSVAVSESTTSLPAKFTLDKTGLWFAGENDKGETKSKYVSRTPFFLKRIAEVFNEQEGTYYVFEVRKPNYDAEEITLAAARVTGVGAPALMASIGVRISEPLVFQAYLHEAAALFQAQGRSTVIYKQFGWRDEDTTFFVGNRMYTPTGVVNVVGAGGTQDRARHFPLLGDLETWTDNADKLCAPGCEAQQFAILASAAAPLMKFHQKDEGGAIYSMYSWLTATGKSTAFDAAQSFWGERDGMAITNIGTIKSRNAIMATGCNIPVFFDEASQRDPKVLLEFCQTFTNGRGGDGLLQDGTIRQNPLTWQTVLLCGSNVPMLEILASAGGSIAMTTRILEVGTSIPPELKGSGEAMRRSLKDNAGQAGHKYLQYLTQVPEVLAWTKNGLATAFDTVGAGFAREARFLIRLITAAEKAGTILRKLDIFHCDPVRMREWALDCARSQLSSMSTFALEDSITAYLNAYPNDILTVQGEGRDAGYTHHRPTRETRGRFETGTGMLYIAVAPFRKWLASRDFSYQGVCEVLKAKGTLLDTKLLTLTAGTVLSSMGQTQCLVLRSEIVGLSFNREKQENVLEFRK